MKYRFSRRFLVCSLAAAALFAPGQPAAGQAPKKPAAYLRLWNMALALNAPVEVSTGVEPGARPLLSAPPANFYTGYLPVLPGHYALRVHRASDPRTPLQVLDAGLADQGYYTVLVSQRAGGEITCELIDDNPDPKNPAVNTLVVRQYSAGSSVVVSAGGQRTNPLAFGDAQTLPQMPGGAVPVTMRALTPKGPRNWAAEADFKGAHRATVFVYPDTYGRVRFKLTSDGPSEPVE